MIRADTVRNTAQTMLDRNQRRGEIGASERMRQDDPTTEGSSVASKARLSKFSVAALSLLMIFRASSVVISVSSYG
ncbi:MAG: hypothetical protein BRD53_02035 [Bacteroidetes bacterium SW_7_64_58]|nr:MAG: hypothetical protein BRD53_02035 [Bacteroidetes bacterium SW_7_64_58]